MSIGNKYVIHQTVPSSCIDGKCRSTFMALLSLAQDLASSHYGTGGISIPHLQKKGYTWVITKQRFEVTEYPLWLDSYHAETWAHAPRGPFCYRDFAYYFTADGKYPTIDDAFKAQIEQGGRSSLYTPAGLYENDEAATAPNAPVPGQKPFFKGSSLWMVLDLSTGRPVKAGPEIMGTMQFCEDKALDGELPKIRDPEKWEYEVEFTPTNLDIDLNNHVNNLAYDRWVLSYLPERAFRGKLVKAIDLYFAYQALFGDELVCRCAEISPDLWVHSIIRKADGVEMFRARTEWAPEEQMSRLLETR